MLIVLITAAVLYLICKKEQRRNRLQKRQSLRRPHQRQQFLGYYKKLQL
ncbi:MAG: hypothetical protein L6V93_09770 [Clostridiales bacterium]|nr:MAG: hypothetical protein L6V93_09770 [Clostridiales bacterium]